MVSVVHFLAFAHADGRMMIEMFQAMWAGSMGVGVMDGFNTVITRSVTEQ